MLRHKQQNKQITMDKFQSLINGSKPVLVDFFATWCGPCKMMAPILTEVKETLGDSVTIIKIDVDKNQSLMASPQFQLRGVPTLMLFKEGKVLWKQAGVVPKEEIVSRIKSVC
ncbi:thioredoxin [Flavobacterium sp. RNTU_13]|uniref:thioredoxin n=1 Tax=Flavobacterium sp. RNTU_13 TaxID=3375145 RepID=UPI0039863D20